MKNNLSDLNNHLFSMLEELEDDEVFQDKEKAERTLKRAKAMTQVSSQILNIARIQVQAIRTAESCGLLNENMQKGWFKKGQRSWNHAQVGDEAWTTDGYLKVKIAEPNKWKMKHVLEWEKVNGPIPEGKMLTFLNGDHADCRPENLALITNAENLTMNHLKVRSPDPEATRAGITVAKLTRQIRKMEEKQNDRT